MRAALLLCALALPATAATADVLQGSSPDPLGELSTLYSAICQWEPGTQIPADQINMTRDGVPDYLLRFNMPCRGQDNAFAGTMGMATQIWVSRAGTYTRILDANLHDIRLETREERQFVIIQHAGGFCMTADAAPCFLTLEFTDNALIWAEARHQHPSMTARLQLLERAEGGTEND